MILPKKKWLSVCKFDSLWASLLSKFLFTINCSLWANFVSNFFYEQFCGLWAFFCRSQQQDNCAGRSSFEPARHGTENGFSSGRRVYSLIYDLPRIARPSWYLYQFMEGIRIQQNDITKYVAEFDSSESWFLMFHLLPFFKNLAFNTLS